MLLPVTFIDDQGYLHYSLHIVAIISVMAVSYSLKVRILVFRLYSCPKHWTTDMPFSRLFVTQRCQ